MKQEIEPGCKLAARAGVASYLLLCGPWLAFSIFYSVLALQGRGGAGVAIVCGLIGVGWAVWLFGFKLEFDRNSLLYRDGFYRIKIASTSDIRRVSNAWITWDVLGKSLKVPRLVIDYGHGRIQVNVKPFARIGYQLIYAEIKAVARGSVKRTV